MNKYIDATMPAIIALLMATLFVLISIGASFGQQTTIYGPNGAIVGRETRSGNSTTVYGPAGAVQGRSSTDSQGTTTYYDAQGRITGRATNGRR
jgi:YD repeat-containing protein